MEVLFFVACLRNPAEWEVSHAQQIQKLKDRKGLENNSLSQQYEDIVTHCQSLTEDVSLINSEDFISAKEGVTWTFSRNPIPAQSIPKDLIGSAEKFNSSLCYEAIEVFNYMHDMNLVDEQNFLRLMKLSRSWEGAQYKPSYALAQDIENAVV